MLFFASNLFDHTEGICLGLTLKNISLCLFFFTDTISNVGQDYLLPYGACFQLKEASKCYCGSSNSNVLNFVSEFTASII